MTPPAHFYPRDEYWMRLAIREAERALEHDDVPVGAVMVRGGELIGAGHNERELRQDPTAHAEMIALREAAATDRSASPARSGSSRRGIRRFGVIQGPGRDAGVADTRT